MFRILEISERGFSLSISNNAFCAEKEDKPKVTIPLDEISAVLLTEPANSLSGVLLSELGTRQIPLVCCNRHYLPMAVLLSLPFAGKNELPFLQSKLPAGIKAGIWQRIIKSKVAGQNKVLQKWRNCNDLACCIDSVILGDKRFMEARVAAVYWQKLSVFPRRDRYAADTNILFNYGYSILYAAFAREIALAGLLPNMGIYHHHRDNTYNLASDLMEPLRPCVDYVILQIISENPVMNRLEKHIKEDFLRMLYSVRLKHRQSHYTVFSFIREIVRSFIECLHSKKASSLILPAWDKDNYVDFSSI